MTVLNKYKTKGNLMTVNIMRPSIYGNPFVIGKDGNRDEVCDKFEVYAKKRVQEDDAYKKAVLALYNRDLMCCCAPARCHGHTLEKLAIELHNELMLNTETKIDISM